MDAYLKELPDGDPARLPLHVLAMKEDRIVGVATLKNKNVLQEMFPGFEYWLSGVYVPPAFRRKGIATALCREIVDIACSKGISHLYLQTEALDGGLYAKLGWKPLECVRFEGPQLLVMVKDVRPAKSAA